MPAVRLDCGYLSHPVDRLLLLDARLRSTIAHAVLAAVQRLYLPAEADPPTGTFVLRRHDGADGSVPLAVLRDRHSGEGSLHSTRVSPRTASACREPRRTAPGRCRCASPRRAAPSAAGPAGGPVRSTHARHEDLGDPRALLRRQPPRGGLPGRRHARGHRAAARRGGLDDRRAGLRHGRPDAAVRLRPGRPAAARADLRRHGARGHHRRLAQRGRRDRRLAAGPRPGHPRLLRPR